MSFQITGNGQIKVWVDGCYVRDTQRGGVGVWFNDQHPWNDIQSFSNVYGKDHNDFELMAVQRAIDIVSKQHRPTLIFTDSEFVIRNKHKLNNAYKIELQQVSGSNDGINQAHKLARQGAGC